MHKEHGQVTGLIWRGVEDVALYKRLEEYANEHELTVAQAAKQLIHQGLDQKKKQGAKQEK
ncbi:MAG TPA: hypothetical protein H9856_05790 [Candidatus Limosilactobacillus merdigallinarum]|uniref:Uncharacterized protein n=1 Tax=Candidatus Limosilactobacillus merdigallinarum TaxID=2838652 RepID=A0A9D2AKN9_9LACO|nr:hypothetical protein [Candidatus Limosilactobacillus merdigallinarum]